MALNFKHNAKFGFASESVLGTLVARTQFIDIISSSLAAPRGRLAGAPGRVGG